MAYHVVMTSAGLGVIKQVLTVEDAADGLFLVLVMQVFHGVLVV